MATNEKTTVLSTPEDASKNAVAASIDAKRKGQQVSATVPAEYFDGLEDHRWTARKTMPQIVREALDDYVAKHSIKVDGSAPKA